MGRGRDNAVISSRAIIARPARRYWSSATASRTSCHQRIVAVPGLLRAAAGPSDARPSERPHSTPKPPRVTARDHPRRHLARTRRSRGSPTVAYP
jgi:hypothetical protein